MNTFADIEHAVPVDARAPLPKRRSVVNPYCLSHGTLECRELDRSRRFYEEFLGLDCVRHAVTAMSVRLGMRFHIVCVQVGDQVHPCHVLNHWGLDVASRAAVDDAHTRALELQATYGIKRVLDVHDMHGVYSFYLEDLDHNWWEIEHYENGFMHDDYFDFGDRFGTSAK